MLARYPLPRNDMFATALVRFIHLACLVAALGLLTGPASAAPWLSLAENSGVQLKLGQVTVTSQGPFVRTVLDLELTNPHRGRTLAAEVRLALQPHERLRAYALDVAGELRPAVAVERVQARVTFEAIQRRNIDPALVEQDAGNAMRMRVFPVLPGAAPRHLRIELASLAERRACGWYAELPAGLLASAEHLRVKFIGNGVPQVTGLDLSLTDGHFVRSGGQQTPLRPVSWCQQVAGSTTAAQAYSAAVLNEPAQLVTLPASGSTVRRTLAPEVEIVWDASLSMAQRPLARELALLRAYFQGRDATV